MTNPILCSALILGIDNKPQRFFRRSLLPRYDDGSDVIAVISDGSKQPRAHWIRNPETKKLECSWTVSETEGDSS